MKFGVMDHVDISGQPLHEHYEQRLRLIEAYDRLGFDCYHMAEHHYTPLASAPSPSVFLAAVAQRTKRLRFGPLVYLLPFHHPLRLIEEICQLDQMSQGRFMLGVGKGVSPHEARFFGLDPAKLQPMYDEALQILRQGPDLADRGFRRRALQLLQRADAASAVPEAAPAAMVWHQQPQSTVWAAANDVNVCTLMPAAHTRTLVDRYARNGPHSAASRQTCPWSA